MKTTLFLPTLIIGVAFAGCSRSTQSDTADLNRDYSTATPTSEQVAADARNATSNAANDIQNAGRRASDSIRDGVDSASNAVSNAAGNVVSAASMTQYRLNAADIRADLEAKRDIVRTKDSAGQPTAAMSESALKSAIEGRLKADSELGGFDIEVDTSDKGEVTLDGELQNADQVGKAIALALDTAGVMKVTSKIEVDADKKPDRR